MAPRLLLSKYAHDCPQVPDVGLTLRLPPPGLPRVADFLPASASPAVMASATQRAPDFNRASHTSGGDNSAVAVLHTRCEMQIRP